MSSKGRTALIGTVALSLCLAGLAGCGSSSDSSTSDTGTSAAGADAGASPSAGCFLSGFVSAGWAPGQAQLASYEAPALDVPIPHIDIDDVRPAGVDPEEQAGWVRDGLENADEHHIELPEELQPTEENLQTESNAVAYTEEVALLNDDLNSDDANYGEEICESIEDLDKYVENLDNLNQVVMFLQQLSANSGSQAPSDLADVVQDGSSQFEQAFGECIDNLDDVQWIIKVIQALFCPQTG